MRFTALAIVLGLLMLPAAGGTLRLGPPVISNDQYRFPVYLQGDAEGVAALDFRLAYDPAVFSPVSAQSGPSAAGAQKQVSSNVASPGEFVVVMMGFNQNAVAPGQVVEIVLEKHGEPSNGRSILRISEPTMATADGGEISSRGLARTVEFGHGKGEENDGEPDDRPESEQERADGDGTAAPDKEPAAQPDAPRTPRGTVPFVIAGREPGEGGFAGRMPVGRGAPVPAAPNRTTGGETAAPAIDPEMPGQASGGANRPAGGEGAASPGGASGGGQPAGAVPPASAASDPESPAPAAALSERDSSGGRTPASGSEPGRGGIIGILFILGLAPVGVFMVYKVLQR